MSGLSPVPSIQSSSSSPSELDLMKSEPSVLVPFRHRYHRVGPDQKHGVELALKMPCGKKIQHREDHQRDPDNDQDHLALDRALD